MSHFALLLVTREFPTDDMVAVSMAPYQENKGALAEKWDWYQIGGRFTGILDPDYDPRTDPANFDSKGKLMWPTDWREFERDRRRFSDVPIERLAEISKARRQEIVCTLSAGVRDPDACLVELKFIAKACREANGKPSFEDLVDNSNVPDMKQFDQNRTGLWFDFDQVTGTLADWIKAAPPLPVFAILDSNGWHERGTMGWWGAVRDHQPEWDTMSTRLIRSIPPDYFVTVIDCHI